MSKGPVLDIFEIGSEALHSHKSNYVVLLKASHAFPVPKTELLTITSALALQ